METSFLVMAPDTNHTSNIVFGGRVMAEMDKVAFCEVLKYLADNYSVCDEAVTYKFDGTFHCPAYLGDIVYLKASVESTGEKSIVVKVKGNVWRKKDRKKLQFCEGNFIFVTKSNGSPCPHKAPLENLR